MTAIEFTPYQRRFRASVRDLLFRSYRVHTHLDWFETESWIETTPSPVRLAWQHGRLVGLMALSSPLDASAWIRVAAINDHADPQSVLTALWNDIIPEARQQGVRQVAALLMRDWLTPYITPLGFRFLEEIVTLRRHNQPAPPQMDPAGLTIRVAATADLETMARVDQAAFAPPWQMTLAELRQAESVSAICTVAEMDRRILGYQLSTLYFDGSHLARLAVAPEAQGKGVGSALVTDVLRRFANRGVTTMTVNTQSGNDRSQRLYLRLGFRHNGYNLPVWAVDLPPSDVTFSL